MLALLFAVVSVAFTTEAIVGFGSTVITVTVGTHLMPLERLLPTFVPLNVLLSIALVARGFRHIDGRLLFRSVLPWVAVGMVAGLSLYRTLAGALWLQLAFAAFVVTLASVELRRIYARSEAPTSLPRARALTLLVLGGFIHGLFGSGGPMIVYVTGRSLDDKAAMRATLSTLWLLLNLALIVSYAQGGQLTRETLEASATLLPALAVGLLVGERLHGKLPQEAFKRLVYFVLLFAGASLLFRTLVRLL